MNYCGQCGAKTYRAVPPGDHRERQICTTCGTILYDNPKIVVGCILDWQGKILLCRRAIEPRKGYWTLPAGFMECGESTAQGALREMQEETGAEALLDGLFAVIDVPGINQVHFFFRGHLLSDVMLPGEETLEAALYDEKEMPWSDLAFESVALGLRIYFGDRASGDFRTHALELPFHSSRR